MTFGSVFGRTFSPTFQPSSQAAVSSGGWWDLNGTITSCVAAYQPKGAASYAVSLTDLSGNSNNATEGTSPTWDASCGWTFVGVSKTYLKTGVTPTNDQSYSMIVRYSDVTKKNGAILGAVGASPYPEFKLSGYYGLEDVRYSNSNIIYKGPSLLTGVLAVAGNRGYRNGTDENFVIGTLTGTIPEVYIGARNLFGTSVDEYLDGKIQAVAIYNATLTSTQIAALTTAMAAL